MKEHLTELVKRAEADYCEIRVEDSTQTSIAYQGKDLDNVQESHMFGGNVRACVNGCWGFVTFNDVDKLEDRVQEAVRNARAAAAANAEKTVLAPVEPVEDVVKLDLQSDPRQVKLEDKIALFGAYNERMLGHDGVTSTNLRYFDKYTHLRFANSEGTWLDREAMDMGMGGGAVARNNGTTARGTASEGGRANFDAFRNLDDRFDKAAKTAIETAQAEVVEGGTYTVICDPHLAGVFVHEAFGHLSEGDNVAEDKRMQEVLKLGRRFGEDYLNIWDTGLDQGLRGYLPYDDEGVPTQKTWLTALSCSRRSRR